jgi:hypothetical protein
MDSIDDEKFVLHAREGLVVHNLLDGALFRLGGRLLDCGCPGFERRGIEGIWEKVVDISCRRCTSHGGKVPIGRGPGARFGTIPSSYGMGKQT